MQLESLGAGIECAREVPVDVTCRGHTLGVGFRVDLLVEDRLPLELEAVSSVQGIHWAQLVSCLKALQPKRGPLFDFNAMLPKDGIRRISI